MSFSAGNHGVCEQILFTAMAVFMRTYGIQQPFVSQTGLHK
jgi:hypothetical protein